MSAPPSQRRRQRSTVGADGDNPKDGSSLQGTHLSGPLRVAAAIGQAMLPVRRPVRHARRRLRRTVERTARSPIVAGPSATIFISVIGILIFLIPVAAAWWASGGLPESWLAAVTSVGTVWVVAHGVPVELFGTEYSLIPWGLAAVPVWLGYRAGRWLARVVRPRRWQPHVIAWSVTVLVGAALVTAVSVASDTDLVHTSARRAAVAALCLWGLAVGCGMWRSSPVASVALRRIPVSIRAATRGGAVAVASTVAWSCGLLVVALVASFENVARFAATLAPTVYDGVVLFVVGLAYVPTLIMWSLAYLTGAGLAVGPEVLLSPFVASGSIDPIPALPALAVFSEPMDSTYSWMPGLVVLSGVLAGLTIARRAVTEPALTRASAAVAATVFATVGIYCLLLASTGSLGVGNWASVGPDPELGEIGRAHV